MLYSTCYNFLFKLPLFSVQIIIILCSNYHYSLFKMLQYSVQNAIILCSKYPNALFKMLLYSVKNTIMLGSKFYVLFKIPIGFVQNAIKLGSKYHYGRFKMLLYSNSKYHCARVQSAAELYLKYRNTLLPSQMVNSQIDYYGRCLKRIWSHLRWIECFRKNYIISKSNN